MPPKQKKTSRRRRGRQSGKSHQVLNMPYVVYIPTGKTVDVSLKQVMAKTTLFQGVPWRLRSVRCEAVVTNAATAGKELVPHPAFLQLQVNSAELSNVEGLKSVRWLVTPAIPRVRYLRVPSPNAWKEDEQRGQAIVSLTNLTFGAELINTITAYIQLTIQFGPFVLDNPSSIPSNYADFAVAGPSGLLPSFRRLSLSSSAGTGGGEIGDDDTPSVSSPYDVIE